MTTKTGYAQRKFKDAGTETEFARGDKVTVDEGSYTNYLAAGLVGDKGSASKPTDAAAKPAADKSA